MKKFLFLAAVCGIAFTQIAQAQWISSGNTRSISLGQSIARDASGNVYGTGTFTCDLIIQQDTLHNPSCGSATTLPLAVSRFDGYLVKYTADGKLLWSRQITGNETNTLFEITGVSASPSALFITGHYKGSLTFGSTVVTNSTAVNDAFVACYDLNGNFLWVKTQFARKAADEATAASISAGTDGSVVFTGKYKGAFISSNDADTIRSSTYAFYLMKFNASGTYLWLKSSKGKNGGSRAEGKDLWQDTNGNIFLTGNVTDTVFVQSDTLTFATGTSGIFISKFNSSGKLTWLKKERAAHVNTIELEKSQKFFLLGGDYKNNNKLDTTTLTTAASYGGYVARYDTAGVMQWVKTLTVPAADSAAVVFGITGDTDGSVYATGIFGKKTSSGAVLTAGSKSITASPGFTFYVAKYKQDGTTQWLQSYANGKTDAGTDIVAYDSSQVFITGYFNTSMRIDSSVVSNSSVGLNAFVARIDACPFFSATVKTPASVVACKKDSILLQAVTGSGLIYQWQKNGVNISGATNTNFYAKDSALYRVVVHSSDPAVGCVKYSPGIFITINPLPDTAVHYSGKLEFCQGANVTLNASFGNTYKWLLSGTPISGATGASYTASTSGKYRAVLTSNKGCRDSSRTFTVVAEPVPAPLLTPAGKFTICQGDTVFMQTTATPTFSYQWYRNNILLTHDTLTAYKAFTAGRYKVQVKNRLGCATFSPEDTVLVNSAPAANITSSGSLTSCPYTLPTLYTSADATTNTVQWLKDGSVLPVSGNAYTPSQSGVYHVRVKNAINCSNESAKLTVTIHAQPTAAATLAGSSSFCAGDSVRITATTGTYTYLWQRNGITVPGAQSAVFYGKQAGSYRVILSDNNQCSDTSAVVPLTLFPVPTASIQPSGNLTFCTGDSVRLDATSGTGLSYEWFLNGTAVPGMNSRTQTIKTSGDYTVRVYNSIGCADTSAAFNIHVYTVPPNTVTYSGPLEFCAGGQVTLSAAEDPAFLYQWRKNNVTVASGGNSASYSVTTSGTYTVVVSINAKCTSTSGPHTVTVKPMVKPVITVDNEFISTASFLSYQWYKNGSPVAGAVNQIYKVTENGQYSLQVSDVSTCSAEADPVTVCIPVPHIQSNGNVLSATPGSSYQWYVNNVAISNATSQSYLVNATGDYKIRVSRADGCTSFSNTLHICMPPPVITAGENYVLTSSPGLTYQWFLNGTAIPDADTRIIVAAETGDYTVQVQDLSGCISVSVPVYIFVDMLSITNGFRNASVRCYPNPFDNRISIDVQSLSLLPLNASVYDMNGSLLTEQLLINAEESMPTDQLPPGSYVLLLTTASDRFYYKLLKMPK
ncbi:T9SS type A sorting domain-containing protein [Cytophaga hutchinsonii]|uniref:CHU large protein uncharacterized n=1 Tax=Cytophaga hutchinsonii (strain ATCC 33406 / DSM 1761 / CIP 103989 / NBRC 15051 / NCIMB 9469 / D465) TaxID=269798 RepID=A0A6N4SUL9_CYTH3|nr:T9SS type A sorting domain-containing protein [Cytophaga hutchinsonii]ABG60164.1 CHU large protein; uncharacterized [Cytophaga hutchinsonii ATCC 33406]SFX22850.1 Por secretion system C-terminal sorting domain-containing protein [Cytophaga hutchinsonii ATCC 33406]